MFLTLDDYRSVCDSYEFEVITGQPQERAATEAAALETIASYLRSRYDIERAFSASGCCRNSMLVQVAVNITLWLMVHRLPQNMGHERRQCLYDEALRWLRDVQASKASPDLPAYIDPEDPDDSDPRNPVRFGSMSPNRYDY